MSWTVGETARLARVSVRTLHHYDEIGLLSPTGRSAANYRLYTEDDLRRLHQILVFRELGFPLADIRDLMLDPAFDRTEALRTQRQLLAEQGRRLQTLLTTIDAVLAATEKGDPMTNDELKQIFDGFDPAEHAQEAEQRWGDTPAWKQSTERARRYTKQDWQTIKDEMTTLTAAYVALMDAGVAPTDPRAQDVASRHHAHLEKWFYDCPPEMFANLGKLWVEDERFTRNIDKARPGLAAYQSAAVQAWSTRAG